MSTKKPKKPKNIFKEQDILLHGRENKFFVIEGKDYMAGRQDWLYTLKLVANGEQQFKRCYQKDISEKYEQVKNPETIKLIYGKR